MQSVLTNAAIYGVLIPAVILGIFLLFEQPPWRGDTPLQAGWGAAIGVGVAHLAGYLGVNGAPEGTVPVVALVVLVGLVEFTVEDTRGDWVRWGIRLAAAVVVAVGVIGYMFENTWETTRQDLTWGAVLAVLTTSLVGTLDEIARRRPGASVPLAFVVLATGASTYMIYVGTARIAQMFGVLAALGGAATVHAWWRGSATWTRGGVAVWGLLFSALFMAGYFGSFDAPKWPALALVLAPHVLWIGELPGLSKLDGWKGTVVRVVVLAAVVGALVYWTSVALETGDAGGGDGGGGDGGDGGGEFGDYSDMYG